MRSICSGSCEVFCWLRQMFQYGRLLKLLHHGECNVLVHASVVSMFSLMPVISPFSVCVMRLQASCCN